MILTTLLMIDEKIASFIVLDSLEETSRESQQKVIIIIMMYAASSFVIITPSSEITKSLPMEILIDDSDNYWKA